MTNTRKRCEHGIVPVMDCLVCVSAPVAEAEPPDAPAPQDPPEWATDCMYWHGEVLTGRYRHWCAEWDGLPIDESMREFECCLCFPGEKRPND